MSTAAAAALVGNSNDLVGEILSRLPLSSVVQCQWVCKEWCSLTSTQSFIDMYENMNHPSPPFRRAADSNNHSCFVVQYFNCDDSYFMDNNIKSTSKSDHHFDTILFHLEDNYDKDMVLREYIDLSSIFSLRGRGRGGGGGGGEKKYNNRGTNTNFFHKKRYYDIKLISSYRGFLLFTAKPPFLPSMSVVSALFRRWLTKDDDDEEEKPAAAANMSSVSSLFRRWLTKDDEEDLDLILYNPVTKEQYIVAAPPRTHVYCGFYYHSPTKEYRILYQLILNQYQAKTGGGGGGVQFLVFSLQTQVMRVLKKLQDSNNTTTTTTRPDAASAYYYHPDSSTPPVISNGSLHWIVSEDDLHGRLHHPRIPDCSCTILSFGMESEEFRLMPHPTLSHSCSGRGSNGHRHKMNLLEMEGGVLCLCDGHGTYDQFPKPMEIYVMEDYEKWTWVRRYLIDLSGYVDRYNCEYGLHCKALQILQGDQLLLQVHHHPYTNLNVEYALYLLNPHLQQLGRSMRIINPDKNKKENKRQPSSVGNMVVLTPSLASIFQRNRSSAT